MKPKPCCRAEPAHGSTTTRQHVYSHAKASVFDRGSTMRGSCLSPSIATAPQAKATVVGRLAAEAEGEGSCLSPSTYLHYRRRPVALSQPGRQGQLVADRRSVLALPAGARDGRSTVCSREGGGKTGQRQCLNREGSGKTRQRQCLSSESGGNTRQRQCLSREGGGKAAAYHSRWIRACVSEAFERAGVSPGFEKASFAQPARPPPRPQTNILCISLAGFVWAGVLNLWAGVLNKINTRHRRIAAKRQEKEQLPPAYTVRRRDEHPPILIGVGR